MHHFVGESRPTTLGVILHSETFDLTLKFNRRNGYRWRKGQNQYASTKPDKCHENETRTKRQLSTRQ